MRALYPITHHFSAYFGGDMEVNGFLARWRKRLAASGGKQKDLRRQRTHHRFAWRNRSPAPRPGRVLLDTRQPQCMITLSPLTRLLPTHPQFLGNLAVGLVLYRQQHDPQPHKPHQRLAFRRFQTNTDRCLHHHFLFIEMALYCVIFMAGYTWNPLR